MIELHPPILNKNEIKAVNSCLKSGWLSASGNYVKKFEKELSSFIKTKNIICCNSGTSALHISLKASGIQSGNEVLVPTITYAATVNVILYENANPVFLDCDKKLNLDLVKTLNFLEKNTFFLKGCTYNKKTKKKIHAIIVTHVMGNPVELEKLKKICLKKNIILIEDAAESLGSFIVKNKKNFHTGLEGDFGCISFNVNKIITSGGGGAIIFKNKKYLKKIKLLINQHKNDSLFFIHNNIGYNYGLLNTNAAIGYVQLKKIKSILLKKKKVFENYSNYFNKSKKFEILKSFKNTKPNYWLNVIILKRSISNKNFDQKIRYLNKKGIQVRPLWRPNHLQKYLEKYQRYNIQQAGKLSKRVICLPSGSSLKVKDQIKVCDLIDKNF